MAALGTTRLASAFRRLLNAHGPSLAPQIGRLRWVALAHVSAESSSRIALTASTRWPLTVIQAFDQSDGG